MPNSALSILFSGVRHHPLATSLSDQPPTQGCIVAKKTVRKGFPRVGTRGEPYDKPQRVYPTTRLLPLHMHQNTFRQKKISPDLTRSYDVIALKWFQR